MLKKIIFFLIFILISTFTYAYEAGHVKGKWRIDSYQERGEKNWEKGKDGDVWEFKGDQYIVYSNGRRISATRYKVSGKSIFIRAIFGDNELKITKYSGGRMQISDKNYIYNLRRR